MWRLGNPTRSGLVIVTRRLPTLGAISTTATWNGRDWIVGAERLRDVVAWMPLPTPWSGE